MAIWIKPIVSTIFQQTSQDAILDTHPGIYLLGDANHRDLIEESGMEVLSKSN